MKILVLSSFAMSLVNFRGRLIGDLVAAGHQVVACAPDRDEEVRRALAAMGVAFRLTPMARAGVSPLRDLRTLLGYLALLLRERPGMVIAYTQKPIIYGGLATRLLRAPFFPIMSGLGYVFSQEADRRRGLRRIVSWLYRQAVRSARVLFVFNSDDRQTMAEHGIVDHRPPVQQVPGSGIDIGRFARQPLPDGPPTFLMICRLMRDKGVGEYVRAAALVRERLPDARFRLLGKPEGENPTGYSMETIARWHAQGLIEYLPECRDVRPHLADAHVFVLPSYYREGLPRTLLEAMATGRPVITTDMPGCREPVVAGENGLLVPPRDPEALAEAMVRAVSSREQLERMGARGRELVVERYDVDKVNRLLLQAMRLRTPSCEPDRHGAGAAMAETGA